MQEGPQKTKEEQQEYKKERAIEILKSIQLKNPQLQAIYLWGSVITEDYDPETSDIDTIAIVDEETDPDLKDRLKIELEQAMPHLKINFLYPSALNGEAPKTLTKFIAAESLLYDMPNWQYAAGHMFKKEDFKLGTIDLDSVMTAVRESVRNLMTVKKEKNKNDESANDYPIKGVARLCYLIHQKRMPFKPFRYQDLVADSDEETREVCEKIMEIKEAGWPRNMILDNLELFESFLDKA